MPFREELCSLDNFIAEKRQGQTKGEEIDDSKVQGKMHDSNIVIVVIPKWP